LGHLAPDVVRETVHPATLSCFLRDHRPRVAAASWWALLEPCLTRRERACIEVRAPRSATWVPPQFRTRRRT
jgi:predicted phage tail protein